MTDTDQNYYVFYSPNEEERRLRRTGLVTEVIFPEIGPIPCTHVMRSPEPPTADADMLFKVSSRPNVITRLADRVLLSQYKAEASMNVHPDVVAPVDGRLFFQALPRNRMAAFFRGESLN